MGPRSTRLVARAITLGRGIPLVAVLAAALTLARVATVAATPSATACASLRAPPADVGLAIYRGSTTLMGSLGVAMRA